jgi:rsbT co-antagonist protein RsbR
MALSSDESNRLAGLLSEHAERITQRWTEAIAVDGA